MTTRARLLLSALAFLLSALLPRPASAAEPPPYPAEVYCLAAAIHTEAAAQSPETKAAIGYWILERAIADNQTVCAWVADTRAIAAYHAARRAGPGSWAWGIWFDGGLLGRDRGRESAQIADEVYAWEWPGYSHWAHFDNCETDAPWARLYTRVRLSPGDAMCFWR